MPGRDGSGNAPARERKKGDEMNITTEFDKLADMQAERDVISLEKQELIDKILTPEIKAQIAEIEAEFEPRIESADKAIAEQTDFVKKLVINAAETVKGAFLQAVFMKGRVSWDTKALDGYAVAHPEIVAMRKQGDPTVSIRKL